MSTDRETPPRSTGDPPPAHRPGDPPGMAAIRRFFRRPVFQGIWLWLRAIGRGIRAVWRWLDRNAGPIARGIEKAGDVAARASQATVRVGHAAVEIGGRMDGWSRERGAAGGARLRRAGRRIRDFGHRAARIGKRAEATAETVEDLGEELAGLTGGDAGRGPAPLPTPPPSPRREPSVAARPRPPERPPPAPAPPAAALPEGPPQTAPAQPAEADGALPEAFHARIRALGKRRRSKPLRQLIVDICAFRAWTTVGDLSAWFGMDGSNLQKRHLRPLVKAGRLRLRYPDNPRHPAQAYRTVA